MDRDSLKTMKAVMSVQNAVASGSLRKRMIPRKTTTRNKGKVIEALPFLFISFGNHQLHD
jgi:hypothetical protein